MQQAPRVAHRDADIRIEELRRRLDEFAERVSKINVRVIGVSLLWARLTELSRDVDELDQRRSWPPGDDVDRLEARITERLDAAIDHALRATERLTVEQARYAIQFRADLAELAERLRQQDAP
jgi:predicted transcriptional regulator